MASDARCDHDKDKAAILGGSWQKVKEGGHEKIICRYCGKLFGYVVTTKRGQAMTEANR